MPLPTPDKGEAERRFIWRCKNSKIMRREFPDGPQRAAVCHNQWRKAKKTSDSAEDQENENVER